MGLSTNIYDKNLLLHSHQFHADDLSYVKKEHLKSLNDNLPRYFDNGWSQPSVVTTVFSNMYHPNLSSSLPNQNSDPQNWVIQNHLFSRLPSTEIPQTYPFMGITSNSNTNGFEEFQNNITYDLEFPMTCSTVFPVISEGVSYNMHDFLGNTTCADIAHNQGLIIGSHEPTLGHIMVESQKFIMYEPEGINKSITKETINMRQDQVMIKTDHKKNKNMMMKRNIPSKRNIIIKGQWTPTEDEMLVRMVKRNGMKKWTLIAKMFQGRVGKQCRERWHNHLRPDIKKNCWSEEEDQILIEVHKQVGNKWTEIAKRLPGRSENIVKNHWNATKRRLLSIRTKRSNALPPRNNSLENYIRSITINNNVLMNREADPITANPGMDNNICEDIVDGGINLNLDARTQTAAPLMDASTTSAYVPEQTALTWGNDFTKLCGPMDDTWMFMNGCN